MLSLFNNKTKAAQPNHNRHSSAATTNIAPVTTPPNLTRTIHENSSDNVLMSQNHEPQQIQMERLPQQLTQEAPAKEDISKTMNVYKQLFINYLNKIGSDTHKEHCTILMLRELKGMQNHFTSALPKERLEYLIKEVLNFVRIANFDDEGSDAKLTDEQLLAKYLVPGPIETAQATILKKLLEEPITAAFEEVETPKPHSSVSPSRSRSR